MIFQFIQKMSYSFYNFARLYSQTVEQATNIATIAQIEKETLTDVVADSVIPSGSWSHLALTNLHFGYGESKVFDDLDFSFSRGQKIAIIGASGSGKLTLLALLRGLYYSEATVTCDDTQISMPDIASITSLIPQDPELFENTLRYNITLGTDVSPDLVDRAVRQARVDEFVDQLPQ